VGKLDHRYTCTTCTKHQLQVEWREFSALYSFLTDCYISANRHPLLTVVRGACCTSIVRSTNESHRVVCRQIDGQTESIAVVFIQTNKLAVGLAGTVRVSALDESYIGIVEASLEVNRPTSGFIQAPGVGDADWLASTLGACIVVVESGVHVFVARRENWLCCDHGGCTKSQCDKSGHVHLVVRVVCFSMLAVDRQGK
jgi:hypothetical protein